MSNVIDWVKENKRIILDTYHYLHQNPELSWEEYNTRDFICREAEKLSCPYQTFQNHPGVVIEWKGKEKGPTIALRTDMDALWQNVNGEWKANHSCGHDAHMTMVLHTLRCLKEIGFEPEKGSIKFIFQPAEETGKGALTFLNDSILDDVDYLIGIHVRPKIELPFGQASSAIYHGAATLLKGTVKGVQAHGARPNYGINVIDSLGAIINAVNATKVDPTIPSSAKVTQVKAGGDNINIIPDEAEFSIDLRSQTNQSMEELTAKITNAVVLAGQANGADVSVQIVAKMVAANPNKEMEEILGKVIEETLGKNGLAPIPVTPGGEDFHFYTSERPSIKATMVGLGTDLEPGLHHPDMTFNLESLGNGVSILANSVIRLLDISQHDISQHNEKEVLIKMNKG